MKHTLMRTLILAIVLAAIMPLIAMSQEKQKTVTVKTVQVENGKKIVKDTTFTVKEGDDIDAIVKPISWASVSDSGKTMTFDVEVETDGSGDSEMEKLIIYRNGGDQRVKLIEGEDGNVVIIKKSGKGNCDKNVFVSSGHGQKRVMKWVDGDDAEYEFEMQDEMEGFQHEMRIHQFDMQEMQKNLQEELAEIEGINDEQLAEIMEEINEMNFHFVKTPAKPRKPMKWQDNNFEFYFDGQEEGGVSDIELRDANIKNKPDRLDLELVDINIESGVVEISFQVEGEANPNVIVYNVYGDKVFTGKPVLMNGKYEIKIDLSQKQHGTYYWQIVDKNRSFTDKIRL
ncbi:MAG TPA: hypothetical protein VIN10_13745 [Bacteroidales bacterium]